MGRGFLKRKLHRSSMTEDEDVRINWLKCYSCGKDHDHNSLSFLKQNILLTGVVGKFWPKSVESRMLRDDIRAYIRFCLEDSMQEFDLSTFEYMFKEAYNQDPSNHLLLADLFLLGYFNECSGAECLKYACMACDLQPDWPFVRFWALLFANL